MLKRVRIENFRCIRSLQVPLRPLTVLVGPNDSGKSVFLLALRRLAMEEAGFHPLDHWRLLHEAQPLLSGDTGEGTIEVSRGIRRQPDSLRPTPLLPVGFYQLPSRGVSMLSPGSRDDRGPPEITSEGGEIPALVDYLLRRDRKRFNNFVTAMSNLVPGLKEIDIATPDPSQRRIDLVIEDNLRISAEEASAGVRLLIFFVALAHHPSPPKLILLEEPENGVHPRRLVDVVNMLRQLTQGVHGGHAAQVVLTTHSPYLLDLIDLEKDQALVFRRNEDGSRAAEPADAARLKNFLDEFMLGEVWYNEGESGLVARGK